MENMYPAGPASVPENLTRPTAGYKQKAWLAMAGLALFVTLYFFLAGWFSWIAGKRLYAAYLGGDEVLFNAIAGALAAFLALFLLKALFFVKHGHESGDIEIKPDQEPRLFEFLYRLADEAGAPRPHRVFLSPRVNAAVFYDLSILNLIFPSKKNLEIGLGLVNVLTLGEMKAVLAHEFGHFAQRSMAVGRWVYVAHQIAAYIIAERDMFDNFLRGLSRFDLRIAWIGWLLSLIVWSIRSLLDTVFSLVVMAQRALSREMELQADLVAVSLTGSDALVHALHRLQAADEAWDRALHFVGGELSEKRGVQDIFAVQSRVIESIGKILDKPDYGCAPLLPEANPEAHRVFKSALAQPPRMWATHPENSERESNAKRVYVAAPLDERSAWELFSDPAAMKAQMSAHLIRLEKEAEPADIQESLLKLDSQFDRAYLNPAYRGAYLGRSVVRSAETVDDLYDKKPITNAISTELAALYPETLTADLERLRNLEEERVSLQAVYDKIFTAPGGVIRHRGQELKRAELPDVIAELDKEVRDAREQICRHDRRCRSVFRAAAKSLAGGWDAYLTGLAAMLHYADHSEANLRDAQGLLANVVAVITADRNVSSRELKRLLVVAEEVYQILRLDFAVAVEVTLDATLSEKLGLSSWSEAFGEFKLPPPSKNNINEWMQAIDSWINSAAGCFSALRHAALEQLLLTEAKVAQSLRDGEQIGEAPKPSRAPAKYSVLLPGSERKRQKRLGLWDRFQTADGVAPALARFIIALAIVGAALGAGQFAELLAR
ncbi:heat-shock protein HtpX [Hahella sp. KA22]|uniref:M48 family metallopeptidase n=1 Tax=Hahella sp. KA22 TaxID=1628392 RepID=UPI000FDD186C|nr:M48 family metallopeptidase [Hahella sp. KA22]AZZ93647.1 heat-shock protein HtpX [Hahella sp. KA22]QAY57022.1 heat-shock protein HtpX [Hahella sp. KA22]